MAQDMVISKDAALSRAWRRKIGRWVLFGSAGWLAAATLLLVLLLWWDSLNCPWLVGLYLGATVLGSAACFAAYGLDKRRAAADRWRISEATLQWLAFLGGWPGGLLGQRDVSAQDAEVQVPTHVLADRLPARAVGALQPLVDPLRQLMWIHS